MKLYLAIAITLFLPAALATNPVFGPIADQACGPCIDRAVAAGPANTQSKEFANYLCIGSGGTAVATCITLCGSLSPSLDPVALAGVSAEIQLIVGSAFDYCIRYYPKETCAAFEGVYPKEILAKACSQTGETATAGGGVPSQSGGAGVQVPAASSTTTTAPEAGSTTLTKSAKNDGAVAHPAAWFMLLALVMVGF